MKSCIVGSRGGPKRSNIVGPRPVLELPEGDFEYRDARSDAYGLLPRPSEQGEYSLSPAYLEQAVKDVSLQLSRAGVRLAWVLNRALTAMP